MNSQSKINKRINKEFYELLYDTTNYLYVNKEPIAFIEDINNINNKELFCNIQGPENSPYQNGIFKISIQIPQNYPYDSPSVKFITPIYHPNLYSKDYFTFHHHYDWSAAQTIQSFIMNIYALMLEPQEKLICNNDNLTSISIQKEYKENYMQWKTTAHKWTNLHATKQLWNIFNNKLIIDNKQHRYIIYILWLGRYFINQNYIIHDLWIMNIMPYIIDKVGLNITPRKNCNIKLL